MKLSPWLLAALTVFALAGCAQHEPRSGGDIAMAGQLDCPNSSAACDVFVGVYCPASPASAHCIVSVDNNVVVIHPGAGANKVTWRLAAGGAWQFAPDGIAIDPAAFRCGANGPFIFACTARGSASRQDKYTVRVVPRSGARVADPLDPWVVTN